ncbi:hypothetical protein BDR05DRAFT_968610 [Suillus weaverae]|nr:hypothetical protein BDR05DRAFT_968610 [Suillus weaverae]
MVNTRDKYSSVPSSKTNWDPNWKRAPAAAPAGSSGNGPPPPPLRTRPDASGNAPSPPSYSHISPPPIRAKSSYLSQTGSTDQLDHIDWANLSQEDKDEFFSWLDEFFSRYLDIALPSRRSSAGMKGSPAVTGQSAGPPPINFNSRPS